MSGRQRRAAPAPGAGRLATRHVRAAARAGTIQHAAGSTSQPTARGGQAARGIRRPRSADQRALVPAFGAGTPPRGDRRRAGQHNFVWVSEINLMSGVVTPAPFLRGYPSHSAWQATGPDACAQTLSRPIWSAWDCAGGACGAHASPSRLQDAIRLTGLPEVAWLARPSSVAVARRLREFAGGVAEARRSGRAIA